MSSQASVGAAADRRLRRLRWAAPVVATGVIAAAVAVATASSSNASPTLPARTAQQLLTAVGNSSARAFSGQFTETASLGVPSLPGAGSAASLSWQSFVTGSHSARIWVDGPDKQRVALLGQLSEADVIHNGSDLWTYTSDTNSVSHTVLSSTDHSGIADPAGVSRSDGNYTPASAAAAALKAITASTAVTVSTNRMVAGRAAYTLEIRPRDTRSTVREITVAIDSKTSVPLQVEVFGADASPALSVGFSSISFSTPAASHFNFSPPAGASVSSDPFGLRVDALRHEHHDGSTPAPTTPTTPTTTGSTTTIGSGWTSVLELHGASAVSALGGGLLQDLTSAVGSSGERLLHTALINAVLLPDGRTFLGAVGPTLLEHIAATTAN